MVLKPSWPSAEGDGPLAAAFAAVDMLIPFQPELEDLTMQANTPGRDAVGEVNLRLKVEGKTFTGRGASPDVVDGAVRAYLHALNKAVHANGSRRRRRTVELPGWGVDPEPSCRTEAEMSPSRGRVRLYDTTLRDGTQREGCRSRRRQAPHRPRAGRARRRLHRGRVARLEPEGRRVLPAGPQAGSEGTRRSPPSAAPVTHSTRCEDDANIQALVEADTPVVTLVGKSSVLHVERVLETTREENLRMIAESVAYLKALGKEVVYDGEHFFDGYRLDPEYALATFRAAAEAGADSVVLCDTNGGSLPEDVGDIVRAVRAARRGGARHDPRDPHAQRCRPRGRECDGRGPRRRHARAGHDQRLWRAVRQHGSRAADRQPPAQAGLRLCLAGAAAAAHRGLAPGGGHREPEPGRARPLRRPERVRPQGRDPRGRGAQVPSSYEHIEPALVGNETRVIVSELAGPEERPDAGGGARPRAGGARAVRAPAHQGAGEQRLPVRGRGRLVRDARPPLRARTTKPPFELLDYTALVSKQADGLRERRRWSACASATR
jgi:2-isopropylmalate synthase